MRHYAVVLLLCQIGAQTASAATAPVFTQKAAKTYIGTEGDKVKVGANDFDIQSKDDFVVTLGSKRTAEVTSVLKKDCKDPKSNACQKNLRSALGIGPGNNGLHKRIVVADEAIAAVGAWLAYSVTTVLSYIWNDGMSEGRYKIIQVKIPKEQKEEIQKWKDVDDKFTYKPQKGNSWDVKLDSPSKDKPKDAPTLKKESNGDLTLTFPGRSKELGDAFKGVLCKHDQTRSLTKRVTAECLVQFGRAILTAFQVGGPLDGAYYIDPSKEFPKPKNKLLTDLVSSDEKYLETNPLFYGSVDDLKERKRKLVLIGSWMAFAHEVGHVNAQGDKFVIKKKFLDSQGDEDDDNDDKKCKKRPTFCSNCGGNAIEDNVKTQIGKCKGEKNGALKGCKCYIDLGKIDNDFKIEKVKAAYKWMKSLPKEDKDDKKDKDKDDDKSDKDRKEKKKMATTCMPGKIPSALNGPNCKDCNDADPWSEKAPYKAAARQFCSNKWKNLKALKPTSDKTYKDEQKWSAMLEVFVDSKQKDSRTGLPPVCAISNQQWKNVERGDESEQCKQPDSKGPWQANGLLRVAVLAAADQKGCKDLKDYTLPQGKDCEEIFNAVIDHCIVDKKKDETGGYHLDKSDSGCWEWWINSKKIGKNGK